MTVFLILQLLFDAVLIAGLLFAFNLLWQKVQNRQEDDEVLRNVELQELQEGLQELLKTVRQVGGEVSGRLQDKVREAEDSIVKLETILDELRPELEDLRGLSREVAEEREQLQARRSVVGSARLGKSRPHPQRVETVHESQAEFGEDVELEENPGETLISSKTVGFSSSAVKEIYRLADSHLEVGEIARQTHLTRGEVQLILNLRSSRFTTPN